MANLTAPYNFAPLNPNVFIPEWWNEVSHDVPFKDGEDGTMEVTLQNITPLCICDGRAGNQKKRPDEIYESAHIRLEDGKLHYFLPSTSIKGMLRSVLEVLSFAKLKQFNNDYFGYREIGKQYGQGDYVSRMEKSKAGWLVIEDGDYKIYPCEFEKVTHSSIKASYPKFNKKGNIRAKYESISEDYFPSPSNGKTLVCTGYMHGKECEYYFFDTKNKSKTLDPKDAKRFLSVHKPTPLFEDYFLPKLKKGIAIPIFYLEEGDEIKLGLAKLFRYPYKYGVQDLVQQDKKEGYDLCELLFGFIDGKNKDAIKGRVQVSNAFADEVVEKTDNVVVGVLGQPSASYYPLYISQKGAKGSYSNYDTGYQIAGRKFYRVRQDSTITSLPKGNGNEKVLAKFNPTPSNLHFKLKIAVHNLKPAEIGAILSALTFHNTATVQHNIGLAKGYGYGKLQPITINDVKLNGFSATAEEYLFAFENEMNSFVYESGNGHWYNSEQVTKLLGIHSVHNSEDMQIMDLDDYLDNKKKSNFNIMPENSVSPVSILSMYENEIIEDTFTMIENGISNLNTFDDYRYYIEQSKRLLKNINASTNPSRYSTQRDILRGTIARLTTKLEELENFALESQFTQCANKAEEILSIPIAKVNKNDLNTLKSELEVFCPNAGKFTSKVVDLISRVSQKIEQTGKSITSSLKEILEEKAPNGKYKIADIKLLRSKLDKYLRDNGLSSLNESDFDDLKNTVIRLKSNAPKKDLSKWNDFDDRYSFWKQISVYVGDDTAKQWFDEVVR
ncbi:MAG: hypothetical protein IKP73_03725 [Bacteroidales bacterium]|nr:hypothetical protein [Bacteroidales bacterium]